MVEPQKTSEVTEKETPKTSPRELLQLYMNTLPEDKQALLVENINNMDEDTTEAFKQQLYAAEADLRSLNSPDAAAEKEFQEAYPVDEETGERDYVVDPATTQARTMDRGTRSMSPDFQAPKRLIAEGVRAQDTREATVAALEGNPEAYKAAQGEGVLSGGALSTIRPVTRRAKAFVQALTDSDKPLGEAYSENLSKIMKKGLVASDMVQEANPGAYSGGMVVNYMVDPFTYIAGGAVTKGAVWLGKGALAAKTMDKLGKVGKAGAFVTKGVAEDAAMLGLNTGTRKVLDAIDQGAADGSSIMENLKAVPKEVWDEIEDPIKFGAGLRGAGAGVYVGGLGLKTLGVGTLKAIGASGKMDKNTQTIMTNLKRIKELRKKGGSPEELQGLLEETQKSIMQEGTQLKNSIVEEIQVLQKEGSGAFEEVAALGNQIEQTIDGQTAAISKHMINGAWDKVTNAVDNMYEYVGTVYDSVSKSYGQKSAKLPAMSNNAKISVKPFEEKILAFADTFDDVMVKDGKIVVNPNASDKVKKGAKTFTDIIEKGELDMEETMKFMRAVGKETYDEGSKSQAGNALWGDLREGLKNTDLWGEEASAMASNMSDEYRSISRMTEKMRNDAWEARRAVSAGKKHLVEGRYDDSIAEFHNLELKSNSLDKARRRVQGSLAFDDALSPEQVKSVNDTVSTIHRSNNWAQMSKPNKIKNTVQKYLKNPQELTPKELDSFNKFMQEGNEALGLRTSLGELPLQGEIKAMLQNPFDKELSDAAIDWATKYADGETVSLVKNLQRKAATVQRGAKLGDMVDPDLMGKNLQQIQKQFPELMPDATLDDFEAAANLYNYGTDRIKNLMRDERVIKSLISKDPKLINSVLGNNPIVGALVGVSLTALNPMYALMFMFRQIAASPTGLATFLNEAGVPVTNKALFEITNTVSKINAASSISADRINTEGK